jgi:deazaflavin-dependent oxidoreductase (nitroreductase family)
MGFDAPAGTRGARQPRAGLMLRWMNKMAARRDRRTGRMTGLALNALILTTVGAKSGAERTTPVGWFHGPDGSWLIVASAAGAARNPAWYHNIAGHPGQVKIELNGRTIPRDISGQESAGVLFAVGWPVHAAGSRLPGPRYGLGLLLGDLLQACMPVCLILVQGPGDCRRLLLSYLRLSLGQPGLGPGGPGGLGL